MLKSRSSGLALALLAWATSTGAQSACAAEPPDGTQAPLRLFFIADVHSNHDALDRFVEDANRARPHLVLDGGDMVQNGTWSEFQRAYAERRRLEVPWFIAEGNHDVRRVGPFPTDPPMVPDLQVFSCHGVRFIVLDNHQGRIDDPQFGRLERALEDRPDKRTVVVMHVPPTIGSKPLLVRARHLAPLGLASPTMPDSREVARFTGLMARHRVLAVLAGHAHFHDEQRVDGVVYIVAGTAGGLLPGLAIPREYLYMEIEGRDIRVRRIRLEEPAGDPIALVARSFRFFARTNGFSHAEQGWNYVPAASVQVKGGVRATDARGGDNAAVFGGVSFERVFGSAGLVGAFGDLGLSAALRELAGDLALGLKIRPVGDFNRNGFLAAGGTLNAGMLRGAGTAGVGARVAAGFEWQAVTVTLRHDRATNHRSNALVFGRRF
jgi:predicted phosphodiesterase